MIKPEYQYEYLHTREGFNNSLNHFKAVSTILGDFEKNINLSDQLNQLLTEKKIDQSQVPSIVHALLVDKYKYLLNSINLHDSILDVSGFIKEIKTWKAVDLILTYIHPELGFLVLNPKNSSDFERILPFKKHELITVYAGKFNSTPDENCSLALNSIIDFLNGKTIISREELKKGRFSIKREEKPPEVLQKESAVKGRKVRSKKILPAKELQIEKKREPQFGAAKRMTPLYSVPVTNELFHNGNVEAWKKIILSYTTSNPGLDVYIFYEGERIHDINTLFKWGKVKHGSSIFFAVAGENIKDVAKLQRYLRQGASPRFEDFLRFPVNSVLKLF